MKETLAVSVFCALSLVTAVPSVAEPVQLGGRYLDFITAAGGNIARVVEQNKEEERQGRENRWTTRSPSQDLQNLGIYNDISLTVDDANMNASSNLSNAPASLSVDTGTVASVDTGTVASVDTGTVASATASASASALAVNENGSGATSAYRTSSSKSIKTSEGGQATASAASMSMSSSSLSTATNAAIRFTPAALSRSGRF